MAGIKTEMAKQAIVRYIRENGVKPGEKLPSQDALRKVLGFGGATIGAAINELKDDGVLDVRDKIGVYLIDPNMDGHAGRVIGITARYVEASPYYCCLLGDLGRVQCAYLLFYQKRGGQRPFRKSRFHL